MGRVTIGVSQPKVWTVKQFHERRNRILIQRNAGGIGDILMHRLIFEDFKLACPDIHITFACPERFHEAVQDHPFIDELIDCANIDPDLYASKYDTTNVCGMTEMINAPFSSPHRSDIWAESIGIKLTQHNMHIRLSDAEKAEAQEQVKGFGRPLVVFSPISAIISKNLDAEQIDDVIKGLDCSVFGLHSREIPNLNAPQIHGRNIRNFMALIDAADYAISVDSAAFHIAGGLGKPQVGIFSWADGGVYGKWYRNWELVQRHRKNGNWDCGPCYHWGICPKQPKLSKEFMRKPCITEITGEEIVEAFKKVRNRFPIAT